MNFDKESKIETKLLLLFFFFGGGGGGGVGCVEERVNSVGK